MQSCHHSTMRSCSLLYHEDTFFAYFEQEICQDDEVYIYAILCRLRRILNWDPGEENLTFNKQRGHRLITQALSQFLTWKVYACRNEVPETQRIRHLLAYSLAKLCFYYWIRDSSLVADVLREVFECDGHFSSMYAHIVNQCDRHSMWRLTSASERKREDSATVYFAFHAYQAKMQFGGSRFLDLHLRTPVRVPPAYLAAIYNKPNLLLHFLRYGAQVDTFDNGRDNTWSLPMLLRHLVRILWNLLGEDLFNLDFRSPMNSIMMSSTTHNVTQCLNIVLRAIRQVQMAEMSFYLMKFDQGLLSGHVRSEDFIRMLTGKCLVPKIVSRSMEPSELQHLCRCAIRANLNANWNLPYGVHLLPLPKILKCYLSLSED